MKADEADMAVKAAALMASVKAQQEPTTTSVGFIIGGGYVRVWKDIAEYQAMAKAYCDSLPPDEAVEPEEEDE